MYSFVAQAAAVQAFTYQVWTMAVAEVLCLPFTSHNKCRVYFILLGGGSTTYYTTGVLHHSYRLVQAEFNKLIKRPLRSRKSTAAVFKQRK